MAIANTSRNVVIADRLSVAPEVVVRPIPGHAFAAMARFDLLESRLFVTYVLYCLAVVCWIPAAVLLCRIRP